PPRTTAREAARMNHETALITGACSGIGLAIARRLAARGHALVLVSNREEPLASAAAEISASHEVPVHTIVQDLAAPDAAEALVAAVDARGLQVDILVNNAGVFFFGEAVDADPAR